MYHSLILVAKLLKCKRDFLGVPFCNSNTLQPWTLKFYSLYTMEIGKFLVYRIKIGKFPVYGIETGHFPVYEINTEKYLVFISKSRCVPVYILLTKN